MAIDIKGKIRFDAITPIFGSDINYLGKMAIDIIEFFRPENWFKSRFERVFADPWLNQSAELSMIAMVYREPENSVDNWCGKGLPQFQIGRKCLKLLEKIEVIEVVDLFFVLTCLGRENAIPPYGCAVSHG